MRHWLRNKSDAIAIESQVGSHSIRVIQIMERLQDLDPTEACFVSILLAFNFT